MSTAATSAAAMSALDPRVESFRTRKLAELAALPLEDDVSTQRERERIFEARQRLTTFINMLNQITGRIKRLDERLAARHMAPWRDCLVAMRDERQRQLTTLEALPREADRQAKQRQDQRENALRAELLIIEEGVGGDVEMTPLTLYNACVERGFGPDPGSEGTIFRSRGGLLAVQARIDGIAHERQQLDKELERLTAAPMTTTTP